MISLAARLTRAPAFERFIVLMIVINAAILGFETQPEIADELGGVFDVVTTLILGVFMVEAGLKILAEWPRPQAYFTNGWNLFDFGIVVLSLMPASGQFAMAARLIRILRALRLVTALPKLRLMVATLVRCIPGMGHVLSLMAILFYVYGVAGFHLYGIHDPDHWGTLARALLTLFQIATLEAWTDIMKTAMELGPWHWIYFVSFVLLGTFVVVNLFVAVVINSLEESHREVAEADALAERGGDADPRADLQALRDLLADAEVRLRAIERALPDPSSRESRR